MRVLPAIVAFVAWSTCVACAEAINPPYATSDAAPAVDADVWTGTTPLFGTCGSTRECANVLGVICSTAYPGGLCTHRCETDGDCTSERPDESTTSMGRCVAHVCLPRCDARSMECASHGGGCYWSPEGGTYCRPACYASDRTPPDRPTCVSGTTCDEYVNACFAAPNTEGSENGAPCVDSLDCRGELCLREGYPDGYCVSFGLLPPKSTLAAGGPLPRSTCPEGSVIVPGATGLTIYEFAACFRECVSPADCRAGYTCTDATSIGFSSGVCSPLDCVTNGPCPIGYRCESDGGTVGWCTR
jgi:hypothetical protein